MSGVALVTGSSSGFGLRIALELARRGHLTYGSVRDPARAGELRAAAEREDLDLRVVACDVDDEASVQAAVAEVVGEAGGLDAVVANAGVELRGPVASVTDEEARWQFETNVFGLLRVVRATAPHLERSDDGVLVTMSSIAGVVSRPFAGLYAASKHAVEALSEALHYELGLRGVRVHVVEPGQFPTNLAANTRVAAAFGPDHPDHEVAHRFEAAVKALAGSGGGEAGPDPDDVARAVADAVADPATPLRTLIGSDAELIAQARAAADFEQYEQIMRSALGFWEGYRR